MISSVCQSVQLFPQEPGYYSSRSSCEVGENSGVSNGNELEDNLYVHPLVKKSSCTTLSNKSLEMCTESIGSESGSDMGENDICLMITEADDDDDDCGPNVRCSTWMHKKSNRKRNYPPPLTSMSSVRMESYREDGRLVLRAVACCASRSSYIHAERSQGRLKLQLVKVKENADEEKEEEEGKWGSQDNDGEELGMENLGRPRSCCSSRRQNKQLLNWNPRLVST